MCYKDVSFEQSICFNEKRSYRLSQHLKCSCNCMVYDLFYRNPVTVFKYGVTINNQKSKESPSPEDLQGALTPENLNIITEPVKRVRKLYLLGSRSQLASDALSASLKNAWLKTNTGMLLD